MATPGPSYRMMLISLLCASTNAQSINQFFLPDSNLRSVDASVVEYKTLGGFDRETVVSYVVDCPTARNSHNDACRSQSVYPATVWHTYGSVFEGITTAKIDDSTTYWNCNLASGAPEYFGPFCVKSITDSAGKTTATTTKIDPCYVYGQSVAMVVTANADLVPKAHYQTLGVTQLVSAWDEDLASRGCSSTTKASTATLAQTSSHAMTSSAGEPAATGSFTGAGIVEPTTGTSTASSTPGATGGSGAAGISPGASMLIMVVGSIVSCLFVW